MEVLMEGEQVAPVCVSLEILIQPQNGPASELIATEDSDDPPRDFVCGILKGCKLPRSGGALDLQFGTVVLVQAAKRLDEKIIHRQPDGTAPVGVASEKSGR